MLTVVMWLWKPTGPYRSLFSALHVNTLASMVQRNYPEPLRFMCVTDMPKNIDPHIEIVPLWGDHAKVQNPCGPRNPSCYKRLKMFAPNAAEIFGERFVSIDLDAVVTGDLSPLFNRTEDFIIWGDTAKKTPYNGSMMMMNAGARTKVWDEFHPIESPIASKQRGYFGSDQAWIATCLGEKEIKWTAKDGVYSYRNEIAPKGGHLPANAKLVLWHGQVDPWSDVGWRLPWVREHYV